MMPHNNDPDKNMLNLIYKSHVPKGYRPESLEETKKMLDLIEAEPFSEEKISRMLAKVKGEIPLFENETAHDHEEEGLSAEQNELVVTHRYEGDELPPDIQELIDDIKKKAEEESEDNSEPKDEDE